MGGCDGGNLLSDKEEICDGSYPDHLSPTASSKYESEWLLGSCCLSLGKYDVLLYSVQCTDMVHGLYLCSAPSSTAESSEDCVWSATIQTFYVSESEK